MIRAFKQLYKYLIMKNLMNLGKALTKAEQKEISGGDFGDVGLPDVGTNLQETLVGNSGPRLDASNSYNCSLCGGTWSNQNSQSVWLCELPESSNCYNGFTNP